MNTNQPTTTPQQTGRPPQQPQQQPPPQQPTAQQTSGIPYVGSKISLISKSEIRYEGTLFNIDPHNSSVALQDVRMFGTEGRRSGEQIPPLDKLFNYIIFKGSDIKDLTVCEPPKQTTPTLPPQNAFPPHYNQGFMPMVHPSQYGYNFPPPNPNYFYPGTGNSGGLPPHGFYPPQNQGGFFPPGPQNQQPFVPPPLGGGFNQQDDKKQSAPNGSQQPNVPQLENQTQPLNQQVPQQVSNLSEVQPVVQQKLLQQPQKQPVKITPPPQQENKSNESGNQKSQQQRDNQRQQRKSFPTTNNKQRGGRTNTGSKTSEVKTQFNEDFDFEENLKKLDKQTVLKEIQEKAGSEVDEVNEVPKPVVQPAYNRDNFFDSLSTDNAEKVAKRMSRQEREDQKKLNMETFGESGIQSRTGSFRGGRGRGGSRGRGGERGRGGRGGRGRDNSRAE